MLRFVTSHSGTSIELSLVDERAIELLRLEFSVDQAKAFSKMVSGRSCGPVQCGVNTIGVVCDDLGVQVLVGNSGPYLAFKVAMTRAQADDLASTLNMHVHAAETGDDAGEGPRMDDDGGPSSSGEDRQDPADWWKK